jgi:GH15 family glucan-1,4-alpha-glucosidase
MLSEQYDPRTGRQLGNTPRAFSLVGLVNTARNLTASNPRTSDTPGTTHTDTAGPHR